MPMDNKKNMKITKKHYSIRLKEEAKIKDD